MGIIPQTSQTFPRVRTVESVNTLNKDTQTEGNKPVFNGIGTASIGRADAQEMPFFSPRPDSSDHQAPAIPGNPALSRQVSSSSDDSGSISSDDTGYDSGGDTGSISSDDTGSISSDDTGSTSSDDAGYDSGEDADSSSKSKLRPRRSTLYNRPRTETVDKPGTASAKTRQANIPVDENNQSFFSKISEANPKHLFSLENKALLRSRPERSETPGNSLQQIVTAKKQVEKTAQERQSLKDVREQLSADRQTFTENGWMIPDKSRLFNSNSPLVQKDEAVIRHTLKVLSASIQKDIDEKTYERDVLEEIDASLRELSAGEIRGFNIALLQKAINEFQIATDKDEAAQTLGQLMIDRVKAAQSQSDVAMEIFKPSVIAHLESPAVMQTGLMNRDQSPAANLSKILSPYGFFKAFNAEVVDNAYSQTLLHEKLPHTGKEPPVSLSNQPDFLSSSQGKKHEEFADFVANFLKNTFEESESNEGFLDRLNPDIMQEFVDAEEAILRNKTEGLDQEKLVHELYTQSFIVNGLLPAVTQTLARKDFSGDQGSTTSFLSNMEKVILSAVNYRPVASEESNNPIDWKALEAESAREESDKPTATEESGAEPASEESEAQRARQEDITLKIYYETVYETVKEQILKIRNDIHKMANAVEKG